MIFNDVLPITFASKNPLRWRVFMCVVIEVFETSDTDGFVALIRFAIIVGDGVGRDEVWKVSVHLGCTHATADNILSHFKHLCSSLSIAYLLNDSAQWNTTEIVKADASWIHSYF